MNSSKVFVFISPAAIVLVLNEELEEETEDGAGDMEGIPDDKEYPAVVILVLLLSLLVILRSVGNVPLAPNVPGSSGNKLSPISSSTTTSSPGSPPPLMFPPIPIPPPL